MNLTVLKQAIQRARIDQRFATGLLFGLLLPILIVFIAFRDNSIAPADYIKWLEDPKNGLFVKGVTDDDKYLLKMQYTPNEALAFQSLSPAERTAIGSSKWSALVDSYHKVDYFKLDIASTELADPLTTDTHQKEVYYDKLNYLTFDMQRQVKMVCMGDTLDCMMYHYERTYNTNNFCRVLLGFDTEAYQPEAARQIIITDNKIGIDTVGFSFAANKFSQVPKLKYN